MYENIKICNYVIWKHKNLQIWKYTNIHAEKWKWEKCKEVSKESKYIYKKVIK